MSLRIACAVGAFWNDTRGFILPYVTVMLAVFIGFAVLALDGARVLATQTELQNAADAFALVGAAELDRMPDLAARATNAINNLLSNAWGAGQNVQVSSIAFYSQLPANDATPLPAGTPASACAQDITCSATARFVAVLVEPVTITTTLPASLFGGTGTFTIGAQAAAGYDQMACNIAPLLVCNPYETPGMTYGQATQALVAQDSSDADSLGHRQLIRLATMQDSGGTYGPGNFGYVSPATGYLPADSCGPQGGNGVAQALTASPPLACFRMSGVKVATAAGGEMDGLNTRFDLYANGFSGCTNYPPDRNVRKGYVYQGAVCNASPAASNWLLPNATAAALPLDSAMVSTDRTKCGPGVAKTPCLDVTVAIGDGTWDCATYWSEAFGGQPLPPAPPGCTGSAAISRHSVYQYEIDNGYLNDKSSGGEVGAPVCNPRAVANARIVDAAIVNCLSSPVPVTPGATNVPVAAFGRFFLTFPVNASSGQNPYAEFLGLEKLGGGVIRDMVQLYR